MSCETETKNYETETSPVKWIRKAGYGRYKKFGKINTTVIMTVST